MYFNYMGFKTLCQASRYDLLEWLKSELTKVYGEENVFSSEERWMLLKGKNPACLCAHLDTVHDKMVEQLYVDPATMIMYSPQGIGGDDRCGVYIILNIIKHCLDNKLELPSVFFSTDEETGSSSTRLACRWINLNNDALMDDIRFFIQLDRKNEDDAVYYNCDNKLFEKYINDYGFKTASGTRTDICILCDEFDKAGVNLSCGFNGEHHLTETVTVSIMLNTAEKVKKIISEANPDVVFTYSPKIKTYYGNKAYGGSCNQYNAYYTD